MGADWTYLVADLRTGIIAAELPLANVNMSKPLGTAGTFTGELFLGRDVARIGDPYTLTTPARTAIYALRNGTPWWGGILWTRDYNSDTSVVSIGGADWWSYFDHRKVVPLLDTTSGMSTVATMQVGYTGVDQNQVARNLVALAQSHTGGNLGIVVDGSTSGVAIDRTYYGYSLSSVGDMLRELSKIDGGPDIRFDVGSPQDGTNRPQRRMLLGSPTLGDQSIPHTFEYGGNMLSYRWPSDGSSMASRAFAAGDGIEEGALVAVQEDLTLYDDGWVLLEKETGYSTVTDPSVLVGHAVGDQRAASRPLVVPVLTINSQAAPGLGQYAPGDAARVVIRDRFHSHGIDTTMRIASIAVSPGDTVERATLAMNPVLEDVA